MSGSDASRGLSATLRMAGPWAFALYILPFATLVVLVAIDHGLWAAGLLLVGAVVYPIYCLIYVGVVFVAVVAMGLVGCLARYVFRILAAPWTGKRPKLRRCLPI